MFFTESAARGLIDVIDVIDHAWRPIDTPADSVYATGCAHAESIPCSSESGERAPLSARVHCVQSAWWQWHTPVCVTAIAAAGLLLRCCIGRVLSVMALLLLLLLLLPRHGVRGTAGPAPPRTVLPAAYNYQGCLTAAALAMPYCNYSLPIADRVHSLVQAMNLSEKASRMTVNSAGSAVPRLGLPPYSWLMETNTAMSAECLHGTRCPTNFVGPEGLAASFNRTVWRQVIELPTHPAQPAVTSDDE
jgi:hypothetical protein